MGSRVQRDSAVAPDVARMLRECRRRRGWSHRRAAAAIGTSHGYVQFLESGQRCPSVAMAEAIVAAYRMTGWDSVRLMDAALPDVGRSWRGACGCDRRRRCSEHAF